ncbi:MAG: YciI family protein [Hyphomonadaceae bacterium]
MRYMYLVQAVETGAPPPQRLMEEIGKLSAQAGPTMIDAGGLLPTAMGARVRLAKGKLTITDGPFVETKEVIGGYAIFEFATREEALKSAIDFMELHRLYGEGWEGVCEMRPMFGPDDAPCMDPA